jgi:hypothetical protein
MQLHVHTPRLRDRRGADATGRAASSRCNNNTVHGVRGVGCLAVAGGTCGGSPQYLSSMT